MAKESPQSVSTRRAFHSQLRPGSYGAMATGLLGALLLGFTPLGAKVVALAGRKEVPVFRGCTGPLLGPVLRGKYSGAGGLGGSLLPESDAPVQTAHARPYASRVESGR